MKEEKTSKFERILEIYTSLMDGKLVKKSQLVLKYGVDARSIQRDIDDIRSFLENHTEDFGVENRIVYDREEQGYHLERVCQTQLSNSEVLAVCKILLDSRAFTKQEMETMISKLIDCCVPRSSRKLVIDLIRNEEFHYVELSHKTVFIEKMWEIGKAIQNCQCIEISYQKLKGREVVKRRLRPLAILFSEYYFYLTAIIDDEKLREDFNIINDSFPTIYRMDRIQSLEVLQEKFRIPYRSRFEEGEFRKRVQFMYGGQLQKITFRYWGASIEAVLDRLPTAEILEEEDGVYLVEAEVFGQGIEMWLRSWQNVVEVLKPDGLREKMERELKEVAGRYGGEISI